MKEVTITEDQLKNMLGKIKELEDYVKLLKAEVAWAERGYTQKGWVKTYCGGKPNYCTPEVISNGENVTPEVTPDVEILKEKNT